MQMIDDFKTDSLKTLNTKLHQHNTSKTNKLSEKSNQNATILSLNDSSSNEENNNNNHECTSLSDGKNDDSGINNQTNTNNTPTKQNNSLITTLNNCQQINPVCNLCNKTFANSSNLKHHMNTIHFNEAKWICKECGKVCTSKSNLKVHLRVHLRVKPYYCRWCDYNCMHHSSIRDHLSKCHPDKSHNSCEPGYIFNSSAVPEPESSIPCDIQHIKNESSTINNVNNTNTHDSCSIQNNNANHDDNDSATTNGETNFSSTNNQISGDHHNENDQIGGASGRKRKRKMDNNSVSASISPISSVSSSTSLQQQQQQQQQQQTNAFFNNMAAALFHRMNTTAALFNQLNQGNSAASAQNLFHQATGLAPLVADNMLMREEKKLFQNYKANNSNGANLRGSNGNNKNVLQSSNSNMRNSLNLVTNRGRKNTQKTPMDLSIGFVNNKTGGDDDEEIGDEHEQDDDAVVQDDSSINNGDYNDADGENEYGDDVNAIDENNNEIYDCTSAAMTKNSGSDEYSAYGKFVNGKHKQENGCCFDESEYENDADENNNNDDGDNHNSNNVKDDFNNDEIYDGDDNNNINNDGENIDEEAWSNESVVAETVTIKIPPKPTNTNRRKSQMVVRKRVYSETSTVSSSPTQTPSVNNKSTLVKTNGNNLCKRLFPHMQPKCRKSSACNLNGKVSRDTQTYFISINESNEFYSEQEKLAQLINAPTLITTSTSTSTSISTSTTTTTTINNGVVCPQSVGKQSDVADSPISAENTSNGCIGNSNSTLSCNNSSQVHNKVNFYKCTYCNIIFNDYELYSLHMGMHGTNNPWQCNVCSNVCLNKIDFAVHILHLPKK